MERTKVVSKKLASVGYDPAAKTLEVEIIPWTKQGQPTPKNVIYTYSPFTPERFAELMAAESLGSYFLKNIVKDKTLPYKKVGEVDAKKEEAPEAPPPQAA